MTDRLANAQERATKMMEKVFIECYKEGFDDGYRDGSIIEQSNAVTTKEEVAKMEYERGLNDAWECMKKVAFRETEGGIPVADLKEMFGGSWLLTEMLRNYSANEVIAKIKEYEEKEQKIKVGDIVTVVGDIVMIGEKPNEFIVTWVGNDEVTLITRNGFHARTVRIECLTKTGEHCDIEKCFKYKVF